MLASAGRGRLFLWDVATGRPLAIRSYTASRSIGIAFSPDERTLAVTRRALFAAPALTIYGLELAGASGPSGACRLQTSWALTLSPSGRLVAGVEPGFRVGIWDLESGRLRFVAARLPKG